MAVVVELGTRRSSSATDLPRDPRGLSIPRPTSATASRVQGSTLMNGAPSGLSIGLAVRRLPGSPPAQSAARGRARPGRRSTRASRTIPTSRPSGSSKSMGFRPARDHRGPQALRDRREHRRDQVVARRPGGRAAIPRTAVLRSISINTAPLVLGERTTWATVLLRRLPRVALRRSTARRGPSSWKTYIAAGAGRAEHVRQPDQGDRARLRRRVGRVLVYATNIGVAAAVDAITGAPRWVTAYKQEPLPSSDTRTRATGPRAGPSRGRFPFGEGDHRAERLVRRLRLRSGDRRGSRDRGSAADAFEPAPVGRRHPRRCADPRGPEGRRVRSEGARRRPGPEDQVGGAARREHDRRRGDRRPPGRRRRPALLHRDVAPRRARARTRTSRGSTCARGAWATRSRSKACRSAATSCSRRMPSPSRATSSPRCSTRRTSRAGSRPRSRRRPTIPSSACARAARAPGPQLRTRDRRARSRAHARGGARHARRPRRQRRDADAVRPGARPRGRVRRGPRAAVEPEGAVREGPVLRGHARQQVQVLDRELLWARKAGKTPRRARDLHAAAHRVPGGEGSGSTSRSRSSPSSSAAPRRRRGSSRRCSARRRSRKREITPRPSSSTSTR